MVSDKFVVESHDTNGSPSKLNLASFKNAFVVSPGRCRSRLEDRRSSRARRQESRQRAEGQEEGPRGQGARAEVRQLVLDRIELNAAASANVNKFLE